MDRTSLAEAWIGLKHQFLWITAMEVNRYASMEVGLNAFQLDIAEFEQDMQAKLAAMKIVMEAKVADLRMRVGHLKRNIEELKRWDAEAAEDARRVVPRTLEAASTMIDVFDDDDEDDDHADASQTDSSAAPQAVVGILHI